MRRIPTFLVVQVAALIAVTSDHTAAASVNPFTANINQTQFNSQQENNKAKKDKKTKDPGTTDDASASADFSDAVAQSLVQRLADGLEGRNDRLMLSAFDDSKMAGYLNFEQQIRTLFRSYDSFLVHFRISETSTDGSKAVALVDFEMEKIARSAEDQPVRKRDQLRFEMERGNKGWKIVDVKPRSFFS